MKLKDVLIILAVVLFFSFIIVFAILINKKKIDEKHYKPAVKMQNAVVNNEIKEEKNKISKNDKNNNITIYDLEEGYLQVPFNKNAKKHNYNWNYLDISNKNHYKYEDKKYKSKLGIDVSEYQQDIDWKKVKDSGVEFAILRLGFRGYGEKGTIVLDEKFEQNYQNAISQGIDVGVYFFSQSINIAEIRDEVNFILQHINGKNIKYPIIFDLEKIKFDKARTENLTNEEKTNMALEFCKLVKEKGYTPCVYGNSKTFTTIMKLESFNEYKKWYADYLETPLYPYDFDIWQYSENGYIDGIEGKVDLNIEFVKK